MYAMTLNEKLNFDWREVPMVVHSASKGAIITFRKALSTEKGKHNITVNCILPEVLKNANRGTYLKNSGHLGNETVHMMHFLASSNGDYIPGVNYVIDGGRVLGARKA